MNKNVTKLLATAMVVGLIAGSSAMADHHKGHKGEKDKKGDNGCGGKKENKCKGHDKAKHETKDAGAAAAPTEEAPAKAE